MKLIIRFGSFCSMRCVAPLVIAALGQSLTFAQEHVKVVEYTYTNQGSIQTETIEADGPSLQRLQTQFFYDSRGNKIQTSVTGNKNEGMAETRSSSVEFGNGIAEEQTRARFATATKDGWGRILSRVTDIDARWGVALRSLDARGNASFAEVDIYGRVIKTQAPNCVTARSDTWDMPFGPSTESVQVRTFVSTAIAGCDRQRTQMQTQGMTAETLTSITTFNAQGQALRSEKWLHDRKTIVENVYESTTKRLSSTSIPRFESETPQYSSYFYDRLGRVWKTRAPNGGESFAYIRDKETYEMDAQGKWTSRRFNEHGQLEMITDNKQQNLHFRYDSAGRLTRKIDHYGSVTLMGYDQRGRKNWVNEPNSGIWTTTYNAFGELIRTQNPNGAMAYLSYDSLGRVIERNVPATAGVNGSGYKTNWDYQANSAKKCTGLEVCRVTTDTGFERQYEFDDFGRATGMLVRHSSTISSRFDIAYDNWGRVAKRTMPDSGGGRPEAIYSYRESDQALTKVRWGKAGGGVNPTPIWEMPTLAESGVLSLDASGRMLEELINGERIRYTYNQQTGQVTGVKAGQAGYLHSALYTYDTVGTMISRVDDTTGRPRATESFVHDDLYRLVYTNYSVESNPSVQRSTVSQYLANGNLHYRSDVGWYDYGNTGSGTPAKPQQLRNIIGNQGTWRSIPAVGGHDAAGNVVLTKDGAGGTVRTLTFGNFNKPVRIQAGANTADFKYGPDLQRVEQTSVTNGTNETTNYFVGADSLGLPYERRNKAGVVSHRYFVAVGGKTVAQVDVEQGNDPTQTATLLQQQNRRYFVSDHLGSVAVSFGHDYSSGQGSAGEVKLERQSYDPWGRQRLADGSIVAEMGPTPFKNNRGFTQHEHLNGVGIIHMNGRVYDPTLGRFASVDPIVSDPSDMQMYNRYSYVSNRPLSYTDPSGYSLKKAWSQISPHAIDRAFSDKILGDKPANVQLYEFYQGFGGAAKPFTAFHEEMIRFAHNHPDQYNQFVGVVNAYCGWGGMGCAAMNADFYASIYTTNITQVVSAAGKAARRAAFTAAAFFIAGEVTQMSEGASQSSASTVNSAAWWTKVGTHALVGCLSARANDGSCHQGATSAGVTAGATGPITEYFKGDYVAQASALAVLGGVTSVIAGGKFTNGATMALYGYLWNCLAHGCAGASPEENSLAGDAISGGKGDKAGTAIILAIPGIDLAACAVGNCTAMEAALAAAGIVPAGKLGSSALRAFVEIEGSAFKFSVSYYKQLVDSGRLSTPFLAAGEVLATATSKVPDVKSGFFKYKNGVMEMVYNPTTKEVWHLQHIKK